LVAGTLTLQETRILDDQPILVSKKSLALMIGYSTRSISRKQSAGLLPRPVRMHGPKRWVREEIIEWVQVGCPTQVEWELLKRRRK
jgi:predicted DNA-binding transcriptional regulator AlpA